MYRFSFGKRTSPRKRAKPVYAAAIGIVLGLALFLRLHYVLTAEHPPLDWDQLEYTKTAVQILENGVYAYRDTSSNTLVTPGFPMLLVAVFAAVGYDPDLPGTMPELMAVRVLNCFVSLGAIWFIYRIGALLFHRIAGLLAASFAAVHPSYVWACSLILTEIPFLTCFTALLYLQVRIIQENRLRHHVLAGLLLALTVLIRPNVLPIGMVPSVFLWFRRRKPYWREIGCAAVAFALVMMPWWVRNALTFHQFIPIADGEAGNPFLGGTDPYFRGTIDWNRIDGMDGNEQFAEGLRRIRQGLAEDPWLWVKWFTIGKTAVFFKTMWVGPYPLAVPNWYYSILVKLHDTIVFAGWFALLTLRTRSLRFLALGFILFLGVHLLFIPVDRYAFGMMPFLMLGTAYLLSAAAIALVKSVRAIPFMKERTE